MPLLFQIIGTRRDEGCQSLGGGAPLNGTPTMVRPFPTYSSRRLPPSVTREADRDRWGRHRRDNPHGHAAWECRSHDGSFGPHGSFAALEGRTRFQTQWWHRGRT